MNESVSGSPRQLLISTAIAVLVAMVLLVLFVLPAEYGIDATGLGRRLGLQQMNAAAAQDLAVDDTPATQPNAAADAEPSVSALDALWKSPAPFRTDEMSVSLPPNQGAEIKAKMRAGERFVFTWEALDGGQVAFDMHGEAFGAAEGEFTSYLKGRGASTGNGAFTAPFAGNHGWYWENRTSQPVIVRVKTSGFYGDLHRP